MLTNLRAGMGKFARKMAETMENEEGEMLSAATSSSFENVETDGVER